MPSALADAAAEFGPFDGRVWLNTAHQGPLPRRAVDASVHAAALKAAPHRIGDADFTAVPERLRALLGQLVGSPADQVVLGNSTSHGLHLIANGLSWADGDEVLVIEGDYPATILPWQRLAARGVRVRPLRPAAGPLTAAELADAIGAGTRLLAVTWVDSFTGRALDLEALGAVCRRAGVLLVVNASQALGARPLDVSGPRRSTRWSPAATSGCAARTVPGSPGCIRGSSASCDRSTPTGSPCRPGAAWSTCARPRSATTSACAPSMSSARLASPPRCRGSPRWRSSSTPASPRSPTGISSSWTA